MNRDDDEEKEEEEQQKMHELSRPHWSHQKKKPGPKNKEDDEALKERFPDGQVSLLQIMINVLFLSCSFQCQLCPKIIRPAKPSYFRKHLQSAHTEKGKLSKCQWPDCNYVRTLTIHTLNSLL